MLSRNPLGKVDSENSNIDAICCQKYEINTMSCIIVQGSGMISWDKTCCMQLIPPGNICTAVIYLLSKDMKGQQKG